MKKVKVSVFCGHCSTRGTVEIDEGGFLLINGEDTALVGGKSFKAGSILYNRDGTIYRIARTDEPAQNCFGYEMGVTLGEVIARAPTLVDVSDQGQPFVMPCPDPDADPLGAYLYHSIFD